MNEIVSRPKNRIALDREGEQRAEDEREDRRADRGLDRRREARRGCPGR